jgi:hypothetical protein
VKHTIRRFAFVSSALVLLSAACGGDDDGDTPGIDGSPGQIDAAPEGCPLAATVGPFDPLDEQVAFKLGDPGERVFNLEGEISDADSFVMDLIEGAGAFTADDVAVGTFTIEGDETNIDTCGVCITRVAGDIEYIATGGTLELTEVEATLTGSATGLTFAEIGDDGGALAGGCETAVATVTFDAAYLE